MIFHAQSVDKSPSIICYTKLFETHCNTFKYASYIIMHVLLRNISLKVTRNSEKLLKILRKYFLITGSS